MSELVSKLIPRKVAKERLGGVSDMTIWRLEQNAEAGFPRPVLINGRCFYEENEFSAWLSSRPRKLREVA
jgi:predicted DNA-binding transcriptional regulator AlpA